MCIPRFLIRARGWDAVRLRRKLRLRSRKAESVGFTDHMDVQQFVDLVMVLGGTSGKHPNFPGRRRSSTSRRHPAGHFGRPGSQIV